MSIATFCLNLLQSNNNSDQKPPDAFDKAETIRLMNRFAYRATGLAVKTLAGLSNAKVNLHGTENLPDAPVIFVINHFTRIETLLMPYYLNQLTHRKIWSLADYGLFKGTLSGFLDKVGAVSTRNPDRDLLIVKTLLTDEASWIIFPEGRMVKSKKIIEKGRFLISYAGGKHPPHTGAATLALRTEFYRQRLRLLSTSDDKETDRLLGKFQINNIEDISTKEIYIVPINITYYPIHARENILSRIAVHIAEDLSERVIEELMTEGSMLLFGVDIDVRFGKSISIMEYLDHSKISRDIASSAQINFDDPIISRRKMRKEALKLMQRYMSDIYRMTTVNHDHIFASMLRSMPHRRFTANDLKRKVYLAAEQDLHKMGVFFHKSLKGDQLHLLTDDRFHRFQNFLSLAHEKGMIQKQETIFIKKSSKPFSRLDLHQIRIDDPISVMVNEVQPLKKLQRSIRMTAWQPKFWQKRIIAGNLKQKALAEFKQDYNQFFIEGESKPEVIGKPFLLRGKSKNTGVVLIHGYMAAPLEVKALANYLSRMGIWVYVLRLKGHGTSPDDLALRSYHDWIESVEKGYALMQCLCRRVIIGGFSMGAGLALELAARINSMAGVFAVSPPMQLQDSSSKMAPAVDVWNRWMTKIHMEGPKKEFFENNPENPHINYLRNPIAGVRELYRLMDVVEKGLADIDAPALVVQSQKDPVVDPEGSKKVFEKIGTEDKKYVLFNFKRHGILLGKGADRVHRVIGEFVRYVESIEKKAS